MNDTVRDYISNYKDRVKVQANVYIQYDELRELLENLKNDKEISEFLTLVLNDLVSGKLVRVSDLINNGFIVIPVSEKSQVSSINSYIQEIYKQNETVQNFAYNMMNLLQTMNTLAKNFPMFSLAGMSQPIQQAQQSFSHMQVQPFYPQFTQQNPHQFDNQVADYKDNMSAMGTMGATMSIDTMSATMTTDTIDTVTMATANKTNKELNIYDNSLNKSQETITDYDTKIQSSELNSTEDFIDLEDSLEEVAETVVNEKEDDSYIELQKTLSLTENLMPDF